MKGDWWFFKNKKIKLYLRQILEDVDEIDLLKY